MTCLLNFRPNEINRWKNDYLLLLQNLWIVQNLNTISKKRQLNLNLRYFFKQIQLKTNESESIQEEFEFEKHWLYLYV